MTGRLLALIDYLLKFQKINIHLKDYSSKPRLCTIGVPKGSVLSPIIFSIFISDMLPTTTGIKLQYADDTTLLVSAKQNSTSGKPCQYNFNALTVGCTNGEYEPTAPKWTCYYSMTLVRYLNSQVHKSSTPNKQKFWASSLMTN